MTPLGQRSIREVVQQWRPQYDGRWRRWIRDSLELYTAFNDGERLRGVKNFSAILGDSGAPELCVIVALYGLRLASDEKERSSLESHIRIVTYGLGIEAHKDGYPPNEGAPSTDFGNRDKWLIERSAWKAWRDHKLRDFDDDRQAASDFCVRLVCIHGGVLSGDTEPSFENLLDATLWKLTEAEQGR